MPHGAKSLWTSPALVRIPFIFTAAVFYGHLAEKVRRERRHALMEKEFAERLARVVYAQTRELREQVEELRLNYERAQEESRRKGDFVATVSHELRTPLQAIISSVEALLSGAVGAIESGQRALLARIKDNALYLIDVILNILDLNRLEAGRDPVRWEAVNVAAVFGEIERMARSLPGAGSVDLKFHTAAGIPPVVSDGDRLKIILRNLVWNAIKFAQNGRVMVRADFDSVNEMIELSVQDTGIGIDEEDLPLIFDMFWQKDKSHARPWAGTGLGLYIVRRLVNDIMGEIDVRSKKGEGCLFRVRILVNPPARDGVGRLK